MGSVMRDLLHRITHRNRREDSLIGSEDDENLSRHSSIRGPYRDGIKDNTFPIYHTVNTSMQGGDVYARSFFRLGNGLGLLDKIGNLNRPKMHFDNGSLIGDLGTIDEEGCFNHCCNIFFPANHSVHVALPQDFVPFHPPLSDDDCIVTPNVFEPGTILTSEGVDISQVPNSKWKTEFKTSAREGAVLVLPTGASREELADPSKLYPYIKEHATSWYQFYNQNSDHIASAYIPNGTLYLVIGVDRATSWSTATFPLGSEDTAKQRQFIYNGDTPLTPWSNSKCFSAFESNFLKDETQCAIFLRLMTVALSPAQWSHHVAYVEPDNVKYYSSLSDLGRRTRLHYSLPRLSHLPKRTYFPEVLFHPSLPLAHILTLTDPTAKVAVVPDSVWISQLSGHHLTHPEIVQLTRRVIENFDIVNKDGLVTFVPKGKKDGDQAVADVTLRGLHPPGFFHQMLSWLRGSHDQSPRGRALRNMSKVLSL